MSEIIKVKTSQAALVANNSHASNIGLNSVVRVYNNSTSFGNVTIQTGSANSTVSTEANGVAGVVKGMVSVGPAETVLLKKDPSDEVFGSAATLLAAGVSVEG
jgi:enterochelin esterase-like enzyme